jgi:ATP-dependent RNA helicase SUPV3L1/SUV3
MLQRPGRVTAVLGPTNTGKTHYAIERMLAYRTGVIGLPLRLLAREVYDRIVALRGPSVVALVTGEERIVPERTQYWVCTVEAMPMAIGADFVAIDEIQLCADPDRGHVFTERHLGPRGLHETLLMGADTMRPAIAALVPGVQFVARERFSELTYSGSKKISRMPTRAAIVGFSVENVYAIAELIRRQKGGCAVVMGALSPRTRNAQVDIYQNGDVDYLVATDAIGMGLNLDVRHIAFSALSKFDGHRMRPLHVPEIAQIAGRAGRYMQPGTFGVTGEARPLDAEVIEAVENHQFAPVRKLHWRNGGLDFGSPDRLIASLETFTSDEWLTRVRESDDLRALKALTAMEEVRDRVRGAPDVTQLWDICRIPDFRGISPGEHAALLARIHGFVHDGGRIPTDWLARRVAQIDRTAGDIDTLSKRLAFIRTWTYVAQRSGWIDDESHWRGETRAVEDRLSDALHGALTQRFVDRRTSVLLRRLKQKETLVAEVNDKGEVTVEGEYIGRIEGFRFRRDEKATGEEAKTLSQAALQALAPEFHLRADRFYNSADTEFDFTEQGGLMWGNTAVGKLAAGPDVMAPQAVAFVDEEAGA